MDDGYIMNVIFNNRLLCQYKISHKKNIINNDFIKFHENNNKYAFLELELLKKIGIFTYLSSILYDTKNKKNLDFLFLSESNKFKINNINKYNLLLKMNKDIHVYHLYIMQIHNNDLLKKMENKFEKLYFSNENYFKISDDLLYFLINYILGKENINE